MREGERERSEKRWRGKEMAERESGGEKKEREGGRARGRERARERASERDRFNKI